MITPVKDGQMQEQIDISKTSAIKCEKCENSTFKQTLLIRKVSALISPDGQEQYVPIAVFACEKCGHVNAEFEKMETV